MSRRYVEASVLLGLFLTSASPAFAGRGTQIDVLVPSGSCSFGATSCTPVDISSSGIYQQAYIYQEGVVSIDAMLPSTAVAGDPTTFGSGIWFTPGISPGTTYTVDAYRSIGFDTTPVSWGLNFFAPGSPTVDQFGSTLAPDMQVLLSSGTGSYSSTGTWDGVSAVLAYSATYVPPANAWIGFSWGNGNTQLVRNTDGLLVGPLPADTDFVSTAGIYQPGGITFDSQHNPIITEPSLSAPTKFTPLYAAIVPGGVPEPASWAMMIIGFCAMGFAVRRKPRLRSSLA